MFKITKERVVEICDRLNPVDKILIDAAISYVRLELAANYNVIDCHKHSVFYSNEEKTFCTLVVKEIIKDFCSYLKTNGIDTIALKMFSSYGQWDDTNIVLGREQFEDSAPAKKLVERIVDDLIEEEIENLEIDYLDFESTVKIKDTSLLFYDTLLTYAAKRETTRFNLAKVEL